MKELDVECEELVYSLCKDKDLSFEELLVDARQSQCFDPRDKVYGILGMVQVSDPDIKQWIKPDYSIGTVPGVFSSLQLCDDEVEGISTSYDFVIT